MAYNSRLTIVFLSLGSNVGRRKNNIKTAIKSIAKIPETYIIKASSLYETSAVGPKQKSFINCALKLKTKQKPLDLLLSLKKTEKEMGRQKTIKWGPRIIDLDILFYADAILKTKKLIIPHMEIQNRRFVLKPMAEIAPGFVHPVLNKTIKSMNESLLDKKQIVKRIC